MILAQIEPGETGYDLSDVQCPKCKRFQRYVIESDVTVAWLAHREN